MALFRAAARDARATTQIARRVGEESVAQHAGTPVATLLRSLGSPEEVYRQMALAATKFSTVSVLEHDRGGARTRAASGAAAARASTRTREDCDWAQGLMSQPTVLFGLPPADVQESTCQARGDAECLYEVTWDASLAAKMATDPAEHIAALEAQLSGMTERLESDLRHRHGPDRGHRPRLGARPHHRARRDRRARAALPARRAPDGGLRTCAATTTASRSPRRASWRGTSLASPLDELPPTWLAADVSSTGAITGAWWRCRTASFFPQERYLLELYARYAATALDGATALDEAQRGHAEAQRAARARAHAGRGQHDRRRGGTPGGGGARRSSTATG